MNEIEFNPKTLGGFVRILSGFFITKDNLNGLTANDIQFICKVLQTLKDSNEELITKQVKINLAELSNTKLQVIMNYVNRLKKKKVITEDDRLHSIFYKTKIEIKWNG